MHHLIELSLSVEQDLQETYNRDQGPNRYNNKHYIFASLYKLYRSLEEMGPLA
jgi:hypothetical protein